MRVVWSPQCRWAMPLRFGGTAPTALPNASAAPADRFAPLHGPCTPLSRMTPPAPMAIDHRWSSIVGLPGAAPKPAESDGAIGAGWGAQWPRPADPRVAAARASSGESAFSLPGAYLSDGADLVSVRLLPHEPIADQAC